MSDIRGISYCVWQPIIPECQLPIFFLVLESPISVSLEFPFLCLTCSQITR